MTELDRSHGELDGFPLATGTTGHLVVLAGFEEHGAPIVFDPAAPTVEQVRRSYERAQFERAWGASAGMTYLVRPVGRELPPGAGNW